MTSKTFAQTCADLGVTKSVSRPRVSNDNPYSEAHFKTLKYRPAYPGRFDDLGHAERHCRDFFAWYDEEHRHVGIGLMTPADVHHARAEGKSQARARALVAAFEAHPERFPHGLPTPPETVRGVDLQTLPQDHHGESYAGDGTRNSTESCLSFVDIFRCPADD